MIKHIYSNDFETYEIYKTGDVYTVWQDGVPAEGKYKTLKDAKKAIDNQEIYF